MGVGVGVDLSIPLEDGTVGRGGRREGTGGDEGSGLGGGEANRKGLPQLIMATLGLAGRQGEDWGECLGMPPLIRGW